ncbi:MAG: hydrolase [Evtepia sp.]
MKKKCLILVLCLLSLFSGCAPNAPSADADKTKKSVDQTVVVDRTKPQAIPESELVPYEGAVEHIFFHPVVAYPALAFDGDQKSNGIDDWMVTAGEYQHILEALYANGYVMVDINTIWSEHTRDDGTLYMVRNPLMLPPGKKPIIISYDDVNYYQYMLTNGFTYKLILGENDQLWSWGLDPEGQEVVSQDLDAVTIMEKFVRTQPDFSWKGAMGCIGLTGYEGILGYRTQTDRDNPSPEFEANRQKEIEAVKPVIAKLKENGWTFASHSWAHMAFEKRGIAAVKDDTDRWMAEVGSLVGPTQVMLYPFGSRLDGGDVTKTGECFRYVQSLGFRIFASVGPAPFSKVKPDISAVICDRMHPDGTTLRWSRDKYLHLYDAWEIIDLSSRPNRPYDRQPG